MEGGRRKSVLERSRRSVCFQNLFNLQLGKYRTRKLFAFSSAYVRLLVNPGHLELSRHCKTRGC